MKVKNLFRALLLIALFMAMLGSAGTAYAQPSLEGDPDVVTRDMAYFNTTYTGSVNATRYERWPFYFSMEHTFTATVTATSGDLVPTVRLLDAGGNELISGEGTFTTTLPGDSLYFVQIEPATGSGDYALTLEKIIITLPSVSTTVNPASLTQGESATVTANLNDIPDGGYSSVEFTCTYPVDLVSVGNIVATDLFGPNPVTALSGPTNGSFIFAIAGSNGQMATTDGAAFTFDITALLVGDAVIECKAKIPEGEGLKDLESTGPATLKIIDKVGTINGKALALKAVTVRLFDAEGTVVATATPDISGVFSITALAGAYTLSAEASGYLKAENTAVVVLEDAVTDMQVATLLAGDIAGDSGNPDGTIDQFDAMSIGMNYNGTNPEIADLNADSIINVLDLELIANNYGATAPQNWATAP